MLRIVSFLLVSLSLLTSLHAEKLILVAGGGKGAPGGPATECAIGQPFGTAIDSKGNLFFADFSEFVVWKVDPKGILTKIAGTGENKFAGDGGPAIEGSFSDMHDLILDQEDNIYLADSHNYAVRKIDARTGILSTVAGTGKKGISGDGGPGNIAGLDGVASIYFDRNCEKMYISGFSSVVRVLDMKTGIIDTIKGLPGGRSVAIDSQGNLYVAGGSTLRVRRPDGTLETLVDKKTAQPGEITVGDNTKHLGFDPHENVLIADDFGHAIKKYLVAEKKMILVAGTGKRGAAGLNGPPLEAQLDGPHGIYYHAPSNTTYISDSRNKRVLKIVPNETPAGKSP